MEYGINRKTILTELKYFKICSGALIPDIMHDMLEGVLQYEVKLLLEHLIKECRHFKLSFFNHMIEAIELGYMEVRNRPTLIVLNMEDRLLKQNGMTVNLFVCL